MRALLRRLLHLLRRSRHDADLRDEIEAHRALGRTRSSATASRPATRRRRAGGRWATSRSPSRTHATYGRCACSTACGRMSGPRFADCARVRASRRRDRHARARHRRQHGAVLDLQQPHHAPAACAGSRKPRAAHRRIVVIPRVAGDRGARRPSCSTAPSPGLVRASTSRRAAERCPWTAPTSAGASSTCSACRHSAAGCSRQPTTAPPRRTAPSPSSAIASGASTSAAPTMSSAVSSPCSASALLVHRSSA